MNWQEIKEKYPEGCNKLQTFLRQDIDGWEFEYCADGLLLENKPNEMKFLFHFRDLYDFFDEQGVMINVTPYSGKFETYIEDRAGVLVDCQFKDMPSRTEAEEQAFIKAFEILEKKL